ncbi:hypothetical protein HL667_20920 [Bradyrhizobium sp. 83012]|uniref:Uncharacterized protein n=1 Tax=Bradyrhizobium aeschynomenes TaxID=2734909 RepID=A0ABX2CJH2_9BRAD|nr:hypothetical protein [Bradyrhizobium aeschynomenes]NPU12267.1 hypothetical protein [Bradyrhizobium aeschynomenes]NPU67479.1 hypothetical protein [Bradyrhizobium aeschynomenes]NPV22804.1 hypothetical protein [Bradyrhizobium aeschynomenes]
MTDIELLERPHQHDDRNRGDRDAQCQSPQTTEPRPAAQVRRQIVVQHSHSTDLAPRSSRRLIRAG